MNKKMILIAMLEIFAVMIAFGQSSAISLSTVIRFPVGFGEGNDVAIDLCNDSAGNFLVGGQVEKLYIGPWFNAGISKYSPDGKLIWTKTWGNDTMCVGWSMIYSPYDNSIFQATQEFDGTNPVLISKFDGNDGHQIWQITRETGSPVYLLQVWNQYLLALRNGFNPTLFFIRNTDGSIQSSFSVGNYISISSMKILGDSLWIFSPEIIEKFILPRDSAIWRIPTSSLAINPVKTHGAVDSKGNSYICISDAWDNINGYMKFVAAKFSSDGKLIWKNQWYGWADTSRASGLDINNWVYGVALSEPLGILVAFGEVQKYGTNGYVGAWGSSYMAFLNTSTGDTLWTNKWDDDPADVVVLWNDGYFNQQNQLVMLGLSWFGNVDPPKPKNNFVKIFNIGINAIPENQQSHPSTFMLSQNYPNPFNPTTNIVYTVPHRAHIKLTVYNILGEEVATLVDEEKAPGEYTVTFDGSRLASGVYFYRLHAGRFNETREMVLVK